MSTPLCRYGVALVLGCLFAFPYAGVWKDDHALAEAEAEAAGATAKQDPAFINDIRTMLISIVVGVFALVTIYLTYVSAQASARSVEATEEQQRFDRLSSSGDLMDSSNAGIRIIGVATLRRLIDDQGVDAVEGYRALTVYVRTSKSSRWDADRQRAWERFLDQDKKLRAEDPPRTGENDVRFGVESLRKRAPDVQSALSVVASGRRDLPGYRADFRDADLQGAALDHARLPGALYSGARLDHLDVRTCEGPYANFANAEFRGPSCTPPISTTPSFKGAILTGARFTDADLSEAHLEGAVLREVNFDWATLSGVTYDPKTVWPAGFYAPADRTVLK